MLLVVVQRKLLLMCGCMSANVPEFANPKGLPAGPSQFAYRLAKLAAHLSNVVGTGASLIKTYARAISRNAGHRDQALGERVVYFGYDAGWCEVSQAEEFVPPSRRTAEVLEDGGPTFAESPSQIVRGY